MRNVILEVAQGNVMALNFLHQFSQLKRREEIYQWLDRNNLKGQKFVDWFRNQAAGSFLFASQMIIARLEKEKKPRRLYAHKDFL